jgi:hypothetical protein
MHSGGAGATHELSQNGLSVNLTISPDLRTSPSRRFDGRAERRASITTTRLRGSPRALRAAYGKLNRFGGG